MMIGQEVWIIGYQETMGAPLKKVMRAYVIGCEDYNYTKCLSVDHESYPKPVFMDTLDVYRTREQAQTALNTPGHKHHTKPYSAEE